MLLLPVDNVHQLIVSMELPVFARVALQGLSMVKLVISPLTWLANLVLTVESDSSLQLTAHNWLIAPAQIAVVLAE